MNPKQTLAGRLWMLADLEQANSARRSFSSRAYRRAVWSLDHLPPELTDDRAALLEIPHIGPTIANLILEFLETGELKRLRALQGSLPRAAAQLGLLPRMSPSRLCALKDLGVEDSADLTAAIDEGRAATLPGLGPATLEIWRARLTEAARRGLPIYRAIDFGQRFRSHLQTHLPGVRAELGGSLLRLEEWVERIELTTNTTLGLRDFLTHSALVTRLHSGRDIVADTLGGELAIVRETKAIAPSALRREDLRGDFHLHSNWSPDGRQSLDQIAAQAEAFGWEYIAITDHAVGLRFGGLDADALLRQREALEEVRDRYPRLLILHGAELNVGRHGELDYNDEVLAELDFRLAGVHSHFGLSVGEQTDRLLRGLSHPLLHGIAHLTGRWIGVRPPIALDLDAVFDAAAASSVALEVNGHLDRLDLSAENAARAATKGVLFLVDSDGHRPAEAQNVFHGVTVLQSAGVTAEAVVNTWPRHRVEDWLRAKS